MRAKPLILIPILFLLIRNTAADSVISFNEIMYNPLTEGNTLEWVELHNQMAIDMDISDWRLDGGIDYHFPDRTIIPAQGYLVVAKDPTILAANTDCTDAMGPFQGNLSNGGETLRLLNNSDRIMDEIAYDDGGEWPAAPDGTGFSLAKRSPISSSGKPANWTASKEFNGSPGAENFPTAESAITRSTLINTMGAWRYRDTGEAPDADWHSPTTDESLWSKGYAAFFSKGSAMSTVTMLADNFNASTFSRDINIDLGARQTGIFTPLNYDETPSAQFGQSNDDATQINSTLAPGQLLLTPDASVNPRVYVSPHYDFSAISYFSISLAVDAVLDDTTSEDWAGLVFGSSEVAEDMAGDGMGLLFRSNGGYQVWDNGRLIRSEAAGALPTGRLQVTVEARDGIVKLFINGIRKSIGATGMDLERQGLSAGHVTLMASCDTGASHHAFDNLRIKGAYTEPDIPNLFSTKMDVAGNKLMPGDQDLHYLNAATNLPTIAMQAHPAWAAEDTQSGWIGLSPQGTRDEPPGQYHFTTTFDLDGADDSTARIRFRVAVDNTLNAVLINGINTNITTAGHSAFSGPFTISNGFLPGHNELQFRFTNEGSTPNPMGLRLEMNGLVERNTNVTQILPGSGVYYFRKDFSYDYDPSDHIALYLNYRVNDGAVFYLNGNEVLRVNLPSGPIAPDTPAITNLTNPDFSGPVAVSAEALIPGINVLAVELHDSNPSSDDMFFDMELSAKRTPEEQRLPPITINEIQSALNAPFFIELFNNGSVDLDLKDLVIQRLGLVSSEYVIPSGILKAGQAVAFDSVVLGFDAADEDLLVLYLPDKSQVIDARHVKNSLRGRYPDGTGAFLKLSHPTPGSVNQATVHNEIVINEIMYHNHDSAHPDWIELYNRSSHVVDLSGWSLTGGIQYDFPAGASMSPGAYWILTDNRTAMQTFWPEVPVLDAYSGQLSNSGEEIILRDAVGNPADRVHYHDGGIWPSAADGGGSSLELKDPDADNASAQAWAASDESTKASWKTIRYTMTAGTYPGVSVPTFWNELVINLLDEGAVLLDDFSVIEDPNGTAVQLLQNRSFEGDAAQTLPNKWRLLGTHGSHGRSQVIVDPDNPDNHVLRLIATDQGEHMHNHAETSLHDGSNFATIQNGKAYEISFRAKWLSGSNQLLTRLYFNRAQKVHTLTTPALNGTPGAQNSQHSENIGPTFANLNQSPMLPTAGEAITISVNAADPDGVAGATLWWSVNEGPFLKASMTDLGAGFFSGVIPSAALGSTIQFYVEATDVLGATSTFPTAGAQSRALIKIAPPLTAATSPNTLRIVMLPRDVAFLHQETNVMSNDLIGCTVLYNEKEVFYDCGIKLRSSQRGRLTSDRLGYTIKFPDPNHRFRGTHQSIKIDRSGINRGNVGVFGHVELLNWHILNRAGGIPSKYDDLIYLEAPRSSESGSALLNMAGYRDVFLKSQFRNDDADGTLFKYELVYAPTTTDNGSREGLKRPQPDEVYGASIGDHGSEKEAYRWHFMIRNRLADDDYSRIIQLCETFSKVGSEYDNAIDEIIDVNQWLRASAAMSLINPTDHYQIGSAHNLKLYVRPSDQRVLYFPWDFDFLGPAANSPVIANSDLSKLVSKPSRRRLFYGHLLNIIDLAFNRSYLAPWSAHYQTFVLPPQNFSEMVDYAGQRATYVRSAIESEVPRIEFKITTNGGANFSTAAPDVLLKGQGWLNIGSIRLSGSATPLNVAWDTVKTWNTVIPLEAGSNPITLEAYDFNDAFLSSDSITVVSSHVGDVYKDNLKVTELMYDPLGGSDYEFLELTNTGTMPLDLSQLVVRGAIDDFGFANSALTTLDAGEYVLIVANRLAFESRYGTDLNVAGEFSGNFSNGGESLAIEKTNGTTVLAFTYDDGRGWRLEADGPGHSLVAVDLDNQSSGSLSYGRNWRPSAFINGSPGMADSPPPESLLINEVSPHTDTGLPAPNDSNDWFEIVNQTDSIISLDNWFVSDDKDLLQKYELSDGFSQIAPNGRLVFSENPHFNNPAGSGFGLNKSGEELYLSYFPTNPALHRVVDVARFKGVENEKAPTSTSWGRLGDGAWWGLTHPTSGIANDALKKDITINEIMCRPPSNDSSLMYIELVNSTATTIDLFNPTIGSWRVSVGGNDFLFPPDASLSPGECLLLVPFDPNNTTARSNFELAYGPVDGKMYGPIFMDNPPHSEQRMALERPMAPDNPTDGIAWVIVDEVIYFTLAPWTMTETGNALHRINHRLSGNNWENWTQAIPSPGVSAINILTVHLDSPDITQGGTTSRPSITLMATFSEPVNDFETDDICIANGTVDEQSLAATDDKRVFHFSVLPADNGMVEIFIPASTVQSLSDLQENQESNVYRFFFIEQQNAKAAKYWIVN